MCADANAAMGAGMCRATGQRAYGVRPTLVRPPPLPASARALCTRRSTTALMRRTSHHEVIN